MRTRYNYNRFRAFRIRVNDVFSRVHRFHLSHDEQLALLTKYVYEHPDYKRLTQYELGYLRGLIDTKQNEVWNAVIWRLGPSTGPTRDAMSTWTDEMSTLCRIPGALYGGHFWKDRPDVTYTPYTVTNKGA